MANPQILIITGEIESGKTSLCLEVAGIAKEAGLKVAGILSPGVFQGDGKIGIDVLNISSDDRRRLAELRVHQQSRLETQRWSFLPEAVSWGNQVIKDAVPCDLLMLDELGPLEFHRNQGWVRGFEVIASGDYQVALLVIRPSLLNEASRRWHITRVIDLNDPLLSLVTGKKLFETLKFQ
ncbi:MAG: hypothetical protein HQ574_03400 [Chloroflexi bacterium]|nr:hypothetical protein [Chloroflexota bacterium]